MFYAIDFDTLQVESKSEDEELLSTYIVENNLSDAVKLIDNEDELCLYFTVKEMLSIYMNLGEKPREFHSEEEAAELTWLALERNEPNFPLFTNALGKKLLKAAEKGTEKPSKPKSTSAPKPKAEAKQSKGVKTKDLVGMTFCAGPNKPRNGTSFEIFANYLEENLDEATFDELVKTFIENYKPKNPKKPVDEALGRAYVRDAFNGGYIEETL